MQMGASGDTDKVRSRNEKATVLSALDGGACTAHVILHWLVLYMARAWQQPWSGLYTREAGP